MRFRIHLFRAAGQRDRRQHEVVRDVEPLLARWKAGGLDSLRAKLSQRYLCVSKSLVLIVMALTPMGQFGRALGYLREALERGAPWARALSCAI